MVHDTKQREDIYGMVWRLQRATVLVMDCSLFMGTAVTAILEHLMILICLSWRLIPLPTATPAASFSSSWP